MFKLCVKKTLGCLGNSHILCFYIARLKKSFPLSTTQIILDPSQGRMEPIMDGGPNVSSTP